MFFDWLDRQRKKPKVVRQQYAFWGAVGITGVIATFWLMSLPAHFAQLSGGQSEEFEKQRGAFGKFWDDAKGTVAAVMEARKNVDDVATTTTPIQEEQEVNTQVVMPELSPETIEAARERLNALMNPPPRQILIATTSSTTNTMQENEVQPGHTSTTTDT